MITPKKSMSALDVAIIIKELKSFLPCHVSNIYQTNEIFLFKLRCRGNIIFLIEPARRAHITNYDISHEKMPPGFCMQLRKHLKGMKLVDVQQVDFDRLFYMVFEGSGKKRKLYVELMKNGAIVLTDEEDRVLVMSRSIKTSSREVSPGKKYVPPPLKRDIFSASDEEIRAAAGEGFRKLLDYNFPLEALRIYRDPILAKRKTIEAMEHPRGRIYFRENVAIGPLPFDIENLDYREFSSYNEACDEYFSHMLMEILKKEREKAIEAEEKKLREIVERQRLHVEEMREKAQNARKLAELLSAHIYEVRNAIQTVLRRRKQGESWESIKKSLPYPISEIRESQRLAKLNIEGTSFEIDFGKDAMKIMSEFFQKARKLEEKVQRAEEKLKEVEEKLRQRMKKPKEVRVSRRKQRAWFEKFKWFISSDEILVLAGIDATTNEILVKKYMDPEEIFMHADIHGAPAVIIKSRNPPELTLKEAAIFAASHSRAWKDGLAGIDVFWVKGKQVSTSPPSGTYLVRGSFYIEGTRNWIRHVRLKLAVAMVDEKICCAPLSALKKQASKIAVIVPGKTKKSEVVRKLMSLLNIPPEEEAHLMRLLPAGGCKIESTTSGEGKGLPPLEE